MKRALLAPLLALLCGSACMKAPDPATMGSRPDAAAAATRPTLHFEAPEGWKEVDPGMAFYLAKWELPGGGIATFSWLGARDDPDFVVQNVERWLREWQVPDGDPLRDYTMDHVELGGRQVLKVGVAGTLTATRQLGGGEPRPDWRLLGAVLKSPSGPVFFKMLGPREVMDAQEPAAWAALEGVSFD